MSYFCQSYFPEPYFTPAYFIAAPFITISISIGTIWDITLYRATCSYDFSSDTRVIRLQKYQKAINGKLIALSDIVIEDTVTNFTTICTYGPSSNTLQQRINAINNKLIALETIIIEDTATNFTTICTYGPSNKVKVLQNKINTINSILQRLGS